MVVHRDGSMLYLVAQEYYGGRAMWVLTSTGVAYPPGDWNTGLWRILEPGERVTLEP